MSGRNKLLFLLGGHDLEMLEIARLLESNGYDCIDKQLAWNTARWTAYKEYFNDERTLVGIELAGKDKKRNVLQGYKHILVSKCLLPINSIL